MASSVAKKRLNRIMRMRVKVAAIIVEELPMDRRNKPAKAMARELARQIVKD